MSKYTEMLDFYKNQLAKADERTHHWQDKAIERGAEIRHMKGKLEVYEKLFRKFLKESTNDEVFIYRGKVYEPISHTLSNDLGSCDKLDVTFVERKICDD